MEKVSNPFVVTGKIEQEYFCDRVTESARLIKSIINGNNMVVISPRRMGKTGLIRFCYDKPEIAKGYYTFFIDILHTSSLREFTYLL
ncbi:MAG: ATPase, partial [Bacteroides sp.]|nr:ATPase [Bacteroides sp.]